MLAHLLNPARDAITMHFAHGIQSLQHHQIECALQNIGLIISHQPSCGVTTEVWQNSCGLSTGGRNGWNREHCRRNTRGTEEHRGTVPKEYEEREEHQLECTPPLRHGN